MFQKQSPEVFYKKGVLRNFTKFTGKHLCQSLFFNKVAGLRPEACNFIKKETLAQVFPVNFVKFLRTPQTTASGPYITYRNKAKVLLFVSSFNATSIF